MTPGLIQPRVSKTGQPMKSGQAVLYEKVPLARTVPSSYFVEPTKTAQRRERPATRANERKGAARKSRAPLPIPSERGLLDICKSGEDQQYEFKGQGTEPRRIAKEAAAFLNTRDGGIIFYGIDDDGTIQGSDRTRQDLDQSIQNALRNTVDPAPVVALHSIRVLGNEIVTIRVPPRDKRRVYQYECRVLIRKGTNAVWATSDEARRLHQGEDVT